MTARHAIPAVILAGGAGQRMGGIDKALLPLAGAPMIGHVLARLAPQAGALAISANGPPERFARFALPVLGDPVPGRAGPLAGILAAMRWAAARGAGEVATVAVDTPFLPPDMLARLAAAPARPALTESGGRRHPTAALWPVALAPALTEALAGGERRLGVWAGRAGAVAVPFPAPPGDDPFLNINTPVDLEGAEARLGRPDEAGGATSR